MLTDKRIERIWECEILYLQYISLQYLWNSQRKLEAQKCWETALNNQPILNSYNQEMTGYFDQSEWSMFLTLHSIGSVKHTTSIWSYWPMKTK